MTLALEILALIGFYLSLFAYYQPALLSRPASVVTDYSDGILNYWMLDHGLQQMSHLSWHGFWSGNIFFPLDATMSLSDTLLFQVLLIWPWVQAGVPVIVAYNLSIAVFFVLSGLLCYLFLRDLTQDKLAALVGSAIFTVSGFWFGHLSHYQLLPVFGYPLITWMLWRFGQTGKVRYWVWHTVGLLGLACASPYLFLLFVPPLAVLYAVTAYALRHRLHRRTSTVVLSTLGLTVLCVGVLYFPYWQAKSLFGLQRMAEEQALYSLRIKSFTSHAGLFWPTLLLGPARHYGEGHTYLGLGLIMSLPAMLYYAVTPRRMPQAALPRRLLVLALALATMCLAAGLGPQTRALAGVSLWKIFSVIPGFGGMRVPGRFGFLMIFFFAVAVSLWWSQQMPRRFRGWVACLWVALLVFEMKPTTIYSAPFSRTPTQGLTDFLAREGSKDPLILYPLQNQELDLFVVASHVENGLVNGRSGWTPYLHEHWLYPNLDVCASAGCLSLLHRIGVRFVAVKKDDERAQGTWSYLSGILPVAFQDSAYTLFDLGPRHVHKPLFRGEKDYLVASAQQPRPSRCDVPYQVRPDAQADASILTTNPPRTGALAAAEVMQSAIKEGEEPHLRLHVEEPLPPRFALRLRDGAAEIPQSLFARKPKIEAWWNGTPIAVTFWPDLAREDGVLTQWIHVESPRPVNELRLTAQAAPWVNQTWRVQELAICRE